MNRKKLLKTQFDRQARKFNDWSPARNLRYLQECFDSIGMSKEDELLDVACGSGTFAVFCAKKIRSVQGVDISEGMIELAQQQAHAEQLTNIRFQCHDVEENLPYPDHAFSVVISRSAFHHMTDYAGVFHEMVRCCRPAGRLSIEDIIAYENPHMNAFIETMDREIDISHHARVPRAAIRDLFDRHNVDILGIYDIETEFDCEEYQSHAHQSEDRIERIHTLLADGLGNPDLSGILYMKEARPVFLNPGLRIVGRKPPV